VLGIGFHFKLPLLRLALFISTTADADQIVVLGFDRLLVGQVRKIQAALFKDRLAASQRGQKAKGKTQKAKVA